jgi:hypothetical protein
MGAYLLKPTVAVATAVTKSPFGFCRPWVLGEFGPASSQNGQGAYMHTPDSLQHPVAHRCQHMAGPIFGLHSMS